MMSKNQIKIESELSSLLLLFCCSSSSSAEELLVPCLVCSKMDFLSRSCYSFFLIPFCFFFSFLLTLNRSLWPWVVLLSIALLICGVDCSSYIFLISESILQIFSFILLYLIFFSVLSTIYLSLLSKASLTSPSDSESPAISWSSWLLCPASSLFCVITLCRYY